MLDEDFIGHIFPQNCGDSLIILEKTNKQDKDKSFFIDVNLLNILMKYLFLLKIEL